MRSILLLISLFAMLGCVPNEPYVINSPSKTLQVYFQIDHNNSLIYFISRDGKQVISESHLGLEFEQANFNQGIRLGNISRIKKIQPKKLPGILSKKIDKVAHQKIIELISRKNEVLEVIIQVSDDSVVIAYQGEAYGKLLHEATSFRFPPDAQAWLKASDEQQQDAITVLPIMNEASDSLIWKMPAVVKTADVWVGLDEAVVSPWPASQLKSEGLSGALDVVSADTEGPVAIQSFHSSWRIITLGDQELLKRLLPEASASQ